MPGTCALRALRCSPWASAEPRRASACRCRGSAWARGRPRTERAEVRAALRQGCFQNEYPELVRLGSYSITRVAEAPDGACSVRVAVEPAPGVRPCCKALFSHRVAVSAQPGGAWHWLMILTKSPLEHSRRTRLRVQASCSSPDRGCPRCTTMANLARARQALGRRPAAFVFHLARKAVGAQRGAWMTRQLVRHPDE